ESTFPSAADAGVARPTEIRFEPRKKIRARFRSPRPRVVLPVFPGTNCEYDTERAFRAAGAEVQQVVFRNLRPDDIADSLAELTAAVERSQILALAGGFSAGDEPAGSGK